MPSTCPPVPHRQRASSLVTTLFVVVVLSTIVLAFLQSMTLEKQISRSLKNQLQAELAAEAGLGQAATRISALLAQYPYHCIGYTNVGNQTLTMLSGFPSFNANGTVANHYLLSVSNTSTPPGLLSANNSTAINASNKSNPSGRVGSAVTATGNFVPRECRAPWIYVLQNPTLPHQPNPALANYNPSISRFAYWIEDETSKIDLAAAGNTNASGGAFERSTNSMAATHIDLGALPVLNRQPLPTNATATNISLIAFRNTVATAFPGPPWHPRFFSLNSTFNTNAAEASRFYVTSRSRSLELSGTGQKRLNLNAMVTNSLSASDIAGDLDDLIFAITGNHTSSLSVNSTGRIFKDLPNTNGPFPTFGVRFFAPPNIPSPAQQDIYLKRVAANIRDYIDSDSQPTFVDVSGQVVSGNTPTDCWLTSQWPQAIGKEAVPYYSEHAWLGVERSWSASGTVRTATIEIDQYLEFINPSTKDYIAPPGSFILLTDMPTWSAGSYPALELLDFKLDISGVTFPAGQATVITTNPGPAANDPPGLILDSSRLVRKTPVSVDLPAGNFTATRQFSNVRTDEVISTTRGFQRNIGAPSRGSTTSDFGSRVTLANPQGIVSGLPAAGFSSGSAEQWNFKGLNLGSRTRFVYASGLRGNDADSRSGDPRSLSEQLSFQPFNSSNGENTRFYGSIQGTGNIPGTATLTKATNSYVNPEKSGTGAWPDYSTQFTESASTGYAVIADSSMISIGELGHVYDPAYRKQDGGNPIAGSRGGGRTLKVGQPDDTIGTGAKFSATWKNAAWRLCDVFGVSANSTMVELEATAPSKININSVARDGGVVLRSLLRKLVFLPSPQSDPNIAAQGLTEAEISSLVASISSYLSSSGPFFERGELSQVSYFASNSTSTLGGRSVSTISDRGREEIFRRMAEMITTRSATFSIHVVGEAIKETTSGTIQPLASFQTAAVYELTPQIPTGLRSQVSRYELKKIYDIP